MKSCNLLDRAKEHEAFSKSQKYWKVGPPGWPAVPSKIKKTLYLSHVPGTFTLCI